MNHDIKLVWYVKDLETGRPSAPKQTIYQFDESIYQIISPSEVFETHAEATDAYIKAEMARIVQLRTDLRQAERVLSTYIKGITNTKGKDEDSTSKKDSK